MDVKFARFSCPSAGHRTGWASQVPRRRGQVNVSRGAVAEQRGSFVQVQMPSGRTRCSGPRAGSGRFLSPGRPWSMTGAPHGGPHHGPHNPRLCAALSCPEKRRSPSVRTPKQRPKLSSGRTGKMADARHNPSVGLVPPERRWANGDGSLSCAISLLVGISFPMCQCR